VNREREIELKLDLAADGPEAVCRLPLLNGVQGRTIRQSSTYFDTPDQAIRNAGFSLRVRSFGDRFVQTVKQGGDGAAGLFDRPEWEEEIGSGEPDLERAAATPLGKVLGKKVRKRLGPVATVDVARTIWMLDCDGGALEVNLDAGTIASGTDGKVPIAELELELKGADEAMLFDVARDIGQIVPVRLGVLTKAERGYALSDGSLKRAAKAERIQLEPAMSAAEAFAAIAFSCLRQFRLNEELVERTADPSALHQARVAMRRLRSAFSLFRPLIADRRFAELREEVRWFTDQLGDARNLDVLLKRVGETEGELRGALAAEREKAYERVRNALASARLRRLMLDLVAWIEIGRWRVSEEADEPIRTFAARQLAKRWRKVKKGGRGLRELDIEPLHLLRIEVKKLRYAAEFLGSLQSGEERIARQRAFVDALEDMQEALGELNDAETGRALLAGLLQGVANVDMLAERAGLFPERKSTDKQIAAAAQAYERLKDAGKYWK
jgi:inorganic triphosphatase YgiF